MRPFSARVLPILTALFVIAASSLSASTVSQFNLAEMSQRAQKIYVGTVRSATESTIEVGGGQLAVVTYQISVEEDLRGETALVKGVRVARDSHDGQTENRAHRKYPIRVAGAGHARPDRRPDVSRLHDASQARIGLSTTVGLGQGCFRLYGKGDSQMAVNEVGNAGLFRDMQPPAAAAAGAAACGPLHRKPVGRFGTPSSARRSSISWDPGSRGRSCTPDIHSWVSESSRSSCVTVRSGVRGRSVAAARAWRAVPVAERRPDDPVQSRSGRPRSADQRRRRSRSRRRRSRRGQTSPRRPRRTSTAGSCRSTWTRRTSCRTCRPPHRMD